MGMGQKQETHQLTYLGEVTRDWGALTFDPQPSSALVAEFCRLPPILCPSSGLWPSESSEVLLRPVRSFWEGPKVLNM